MRQSENKLNRSIGSSHMDSVRGSEMGSQKMHLVPTVDSNQNEIAEEIQENQQMVPSSMTNGKPVEVVPHVQQDYTESENNGKRKKVIVLSILAAICVVAAIVVAFVFKHDGDAPAPTPIPHGVNPYAADTSTVNHSHGKIDGVLNYQQAKVQALRDQRQKMQSADHLLKESNKTFKVDPLSIATGENNKIIERLFFRFSQTDFTRAYLDIGDYDNQHRWGIPSDVVPQQQDNDNFRVDMAGLRVNYDPFEFYYQDTSFNEILIDSRNQSFWFSDKFMQIDLKLPTQKLYGFGERNREFPLTQGAWTMFANGQETPYDDGTGGKQVYGVHPFVLVKARTPGQFFGIFFRNSNAMATVTTFNDDGTTTLSYMTTGGNLNMNFFFKGTAKQIIASYQNFIGLPTLTPLWSLGWHASAYAYFNLSMVNDTIQNYVKHDVPLEGVWFDIKYMDNYQDFTVDEVNWPNLKQFVKEHKTKYGLKFIPIIDAGLSNDSYPNKYVEMAKENNALLKDGDQVFSAQVWPHNATFLDWFHSSAKDVWAQGLYDLYQKLEYDGLWLDMNEATLFCNGSWPLCYDPNAKSSTKNTEIPLMTTQQSPSRKLQDLFFKDKDESQKVNDQQNEQWYSGYNETFMTEENTFYLPFIPMKQNLDNMSIKLNVTHPESGYKQFDTHSLFGHMEAQTTKMSLESDLIEDIRGKRTFLLSRSTFAGSGKYTQHWLGDNHRTWANMRYSIAGVMNMNMFGIPMVGPDTCGFFSTPQYNEQEEQEICGRWIQLATFFPFARQHRDKYPGGGNPNEPYNLGDYAHMARSAIFDRYRYIKFLYTCLFEASKTGQTCYDPLLFHYPELDQAYNDTEATFIVGDAVKVSPLLHSLGKSENKNYTVFFPKGKWIDLDNFNKTAVIDVSEEEGQYVNLTANNQAVKKHLRPGYLIPRQSRPLVMADDSKIAAAPVLNSINSTDQVPLEPVEILVNRNENGYAQGRVLFDNGTNKADIDNGNFSFYEFTVTNGSIQKFSLYDGSNFPGNDSGINHEISAFRIFNAKETYRNPFACLVQEGKQPWEKPFELNMTFDEETNSIIIKNATENSTIDGFRMNSIFYGDSFTNGDVVSICYPDDVLARYVIETPEKPHDLGGSSLTVNLTSQASSNKPELLLNITIYREKFSEDRGGFLVFDWNYKNESEYGGKKPFRVPEAVVNTTHLEECTECQLSDYIEIQGDPIEPLLKIKSQSIHDQDVFRIIDLIFKEFRNDIRMQLVTDKDMKPSRGRIVGINDGVTDKLVQPARGIHGFWNRDISDPVDTGELPTANDYSTHPFFAYTAQDNITYGVFANVVNAQNWYLNNNETNDYQEVNMMSTGGVGQLIFMFPTSQYSQDNEYEGYEKIVQHSLQYIIGQPTMVPRWALGWHQCRYGYKTLDAVKDVVQGYRDTATPLDTIWNDIDYMNDYQDFTYDPVAFKDLGDFIRQLHSETNQHYIPIIDAGISKRDNLNYKAYDEGIASDVFIKAHAGLDEPFIGQVWPTDAVYPDFFKDETVEWWKKQISDFHEQVPIDGLWLDMNEASNFCMGVCYQSQAAPDPVKKKLFYQPTGRDLEFKSIALDAVHEGNITELDAHSLFGTMQQRATYKWFESQNKRPMIIARSSYSGAGKFASRWLGDNFSTLEFLGYSVTGIQLSNVMGIPLVGADICGFIGPVSQELCTKWHVVGAFYPFSRNHNADPKDQEPYQFNETYHVTGQRFWQHIRDAIRIKYALIPYYYTGLSLVSQNGGTFFKAPFFAFANDTLAYYNTTNNFMVGNALKVSVQSIENLTQTEYYFPTESGGSTQWCNVFNATKEKCFQGGTNKTYDSYAHNFDVHIRSGFIVPLHDPWANMTNTTQDVVNSKTNIHIHPQCDEDDCYANGRYIGDDGESITQGNNNFVLAYLFMNYATNANFNISISYQQSRITSSEWNLIDHIGDMIIYNAEKSKMNNTYDVKFYMSHPDETQLVSKGAVYNATTDQLIFKNSVDFGTEIARVHSIEFTQST